MTFRKLKNKDRITDNTVWIRFSDGKPPNKRQPNYCNCEIRLVRPNSVGHRAKRYLIISNTWYLYDIRTME